jgi:hypothetical protein
VTQGGRRFLGWFSHGSGFSARQDDSAPEVQRQEGALELQSSINYGVVETSSKHKKGKAHMM